MLLRPGYRLIQKGRDLVEAVIFSVVIVSALQVARNTSPVNMSQKFNHIISKTSFNCKIGIFLIHPYVYVNAYHYVQCELSGVVGN